MLLYNKSFFLKECEASDQVLPKKNPHPELSHIPTVLTAVMREGIDGCGMCHELVWRSRERAAYTLFDSCHPGN